jgi:hypothetical protein
MMNRRNFIRLAGGGAVAAALLPTAGCSSQLPDAAVAAWRGPDDGLELRRWALSYAMLAPNAHNRQPWLADLREPGVIVLRVDRERLLPHTDPNHRQIMISQGTFLEGLVQALGARGQVAVVELVPAGEPGANTLDDRPVARVTWRPAAAGDRTDPLFGQMLRRQTAKVDYDTARPVAPAMIEALGSAMPLNDSHGLQFGGTVSSPLLADLRTLAMDAALVEMRTERTVMESQRLMRVGPEEIALHRDGISLNAPMVRVLDAVGLFDRSSAPAEGSAAMKAMVERYQGLTTTAMGFLWLSSDTAANAAAGRTRSAEVAAGRAYLRLHLKATEMGLQMHPLSQALQEFSEMREHHARVHQLTTGGPAERRTVQMLCRLGHAADQPHTPRRALEGIIRA